MSMLIQQSGNGKPSQSILNGSTNDSCVEVQLLHEESQMYHSRWPTYPNCFGLPYQDHNYGAPPPPTPPASPPAIVKVNGHLDIDVSCNTVVVTTPTIVPTQLPTSTASNTDDSITRCICDFQHDDGYMICCDKCGVWQHVDCMGVDRDDIPEIYHCERCQPRKLDKQRAVQLQRKRRVLLRKLDSSATETEDETKHNGLLQQKKVKKKKKKSRKENKDGVPGMGGRAQWGGNRKHSPPSSHHAQQVKFGRKVQPQHNGGVIQNKPKKFDQNRHTIKKLNKAKIPKITAKALNMSCEDTSGPWDIGLLDSYEEANGNQYSIDIKSLLANQPLNGQHLNSTSGAGTKQLQLPDQLCRVAQVTPNHKGLEVLDSVRSNQPLIEYKGKVMLREQYDKENIFFKRLHPFVLFYSNFEGLQLCVDASVYANDARYVRRSCMPNAQVQHVFENERVHFYIYASKHIAKGSEVTIPFDFNYEECCYGVECTCSKSNCPVLRIQKKVSEAHPVAKPARRRKRFSSSSGTDNGVSGGPTTPQAPHAPLPHRNSSSDDIDRLLTLSTVAAAAATVATPTTKRRKLAPLRISDTVNKQEEDEKVTSPIDTKPPEQLPTAPPPTPVSAPITTPVLPAAPISEAAEVVKVEPVEDGPGNEEEEDPADSAETDQGSTQAETDQGSTQAEKDHKLTREERKMEAILKAFERLEKREERRKEALARLEHSRKSKDSHSVDTPTPEPKEAQGKDTDSDNKPEKTKPKGKKRRPSGTPARRRSRPSSSVSTATESATSADEGSNLPPNTPMEHSPSSSTPSSAAVFDHAFKFPKTKKHLMSEWLSENENAAARLTGHAKTEPLEINTSTGGDTTIEFVKCIPSPQAHSFSRLRRSSMSGAAPKAPAGPSTSSVSGGGALQLDCSIGSAKKRWLRQAMSENSDCDVTPTSGCDTTGAGCDTAGTGYMSPQPCGRGGANGASPNPSAGGAVSPGASPPLDFVTPLKKRRLARESMESPFPFGSAVAAAVATSAAAEGYGDDSTNMEETEKGSCEASTQHAPLPAERGLEDATPPLRDGCQLSHMSPNVSSGDNLFEKFGVPSQQMAAAVAPPDSPTVNGVSEHFPAPKSEPEPSDQSDSPGSAVQYTNADSTELTSVTVTQPCSTPSQSAPDSADSGAIVASTGIASCHGSNSNHQSNSVETSTDVVDPCTSCSEVDTKCTSTEPTVSGRNSGDEAVSMAAVPSSCHSECDSTAASRDSVAVMPSCSSTSRDLGDGAGRTASQESNCGTTVSDSRTRVTANVGVVTVVTTATAGCSVTDSQAVVSVACSPNDSVGTSSTTVSCGASVVAESSSGSDCILRTATASCSCSNSPVLHSALSAESGSSRVAEAPSSTPQQCSVIDSGGDGELHSSVFTADSSLEESQRHRPMHRSYNLLVACSVSEQPTISCSGSRDSDNVGGSSEAGQVGDNVSDGAELEKEEGEITDDDDGCGSVTGTAEQESRAIVNSICQRARELREAEISSSRHYYVKRSRSQSSFSDGHADSSSVSGTSSTPALVLNDTHHTDSQSPTHPPYRWDSPVDSTSPNQHFDLSRTVNSDATSSTHGDSYRDSYVDNSRSPASSSGEASNSSLFSSCGASEASGPSSTCTFFGMDLPTKKKVSLSEYRKRIKQQKGSLPPRGASSNSSKSHRTPSPSVGRDSCVQPRLAPLPMFNAFRSPDLRAADLGNGLLSPPLPPPPPPSEPYPTSEEADKTRDQTTLSLTERLRREFGLDTTSESDEDTNDKAVRRQKQGVPAGRGSPSMPPPPPPPPPPPAATSSGFAAPLPYPPTACVSDRALAAGAHQTSPVPPPPPPPPQIHTAPYYHHPVPVTMAMPPGVTTTLPPQRLQSVYPTAMNVTYGYTAVPLSGQVAAPPLNGQVAAPSLNGQVAALPLNGQVAALPLNGQVAAPLNSQVAAPPQQHVVYHSDSRQHAPPVVTCPVQQMAAVPHTAPMPPATGQPMAKVVSIQHAVQQVAPPVAQQAAPIPHPGVSLTQQPPMSYPVDPRRQYVNPPSYPEQTPVAPPTAQSPAATYPMQQHQQPQQPSHQPLLPTPPATAAPQRPPPGPPPGPPRSIPSLMSLPSYPTKTFSSSLLTGVEHGSGGGNSNKTPQTHPGYTHPPHSSSSSAHPSPTPLPSQSGFSQ